MNQIEKVARAKLVDELALAIDQFLSHQIERDTLACDLTQDELTELATGVAAIAAMPVQAEPQWQGIESAPRDGSEILLWPAIRRPVERKVPCAVGRWSRYPYMECWDDLTVGHHNGLWKPTHWQPLPTPPAGGSDAE